MLSDGVTYKFKQSIAQPTSQTRKTKLEIKPSNSINIKYILNLNYLIDYYV